MTLTRAHTPARSKAFLPGNVSRRPRLASHDIPASGEAGEAIVARGNHEETS
jgi:hypothetical protein